jgi:hypothetical protein
MSTSHKVNLVQARRWNRSSWLALLFALFLFTYNAILAWRTHQVPADGWLWSGDYLEIVPEITFDSQSIGPPSPLRTNDKLVSIEGQSTVELVGKQFFWRQSPAPDWADGTVLTYLVERNGQIVSLGVPVYRYHFGELFIAATRLRGLPGFVQIAGSTFFFVVGVIVFLLRPRERAAHALLILGTAFLFNAVPLYEWTTSFFYSFRPDSVPFDTWTLAINPSLMLLALAFPIPKWPIRRFPI